MTTPTLYEWAGGHEALLRLTEVFYDKVLADPVLAPVFAHMSDQHREHVAIWLGEVFRGHSRYTDELGGYGLPDDPEFRSAFVAYVEWGTRIALANSQPGATPPPKAPVPHWGWGEAPPYLP